MLVVLVGLVSLFAGNGYAQTQQDDEELLTTVLAAILSRPYCDPIVASPVGEAGEVTLQVTCRGKVSEYHWSKNGTVVATTTVPSFATTLAPADRAVTFSVTATGAGGAISSASTAVVVRPVTLEVKVAGSGFGTLRVQAGQTAETCTTSCRFRYPPGTQLTVTASAVTGSTFNGWSQACSGTASCQLTMSDDRVAAAEFSLPTLTSATPAADQVLTDTSTKAIGATGGVFGVTDHGAATYTIPLWLPPGTAGMTPQLDINYSSQGGNGLLGVGWNIGGLSAITRCPKTEAQDGKRAPINYDADPNNDAFCLDGQRLVAVTPRTQSTPVICPNGLESKPTWYTEYRTEIDNGSRIVAYEEYPCHLIGPTRWQVWDRDGRIRQFGKYQWIVTRGWMIDQGTQQKPNNALVWLLDRVEDRAGNYYFVEYEGNGARVNRGTPTSCADQQTSRNVTDIPLGELPYAEYRPKRICYTRNDSNRISDVTQVLFEYSDRADIDKQRAFDTGQGQIVVTKKLDSIKICNVTQDCGANFTRRYVLNYEPTNTGNSQRSAKTRLASIQETWVGGALPPTQLTWSNSNPTFSSYLSSRQISGDYGRSVADYSGKGVSQFGVVESSNTVWGSSRGRDFNRVKWAVCSLENLTACNTWTAGPLAEFLDFSRELIMVGDFNGDGRADISYAIKDGYIHVCMSNGSGFVEPCEQWDTGQAFDTGSATVDGRDRRSVADLDGDGRTDMIFYKGDGNWYVCLSRPNGCAGSTLHLSIPSVTENYMFSDFNGDGKADILTGNGTDKWQIWFSTFGSDGPGGFEVHDSSRWIDGPVGRIGKGQIIAADFNGDGIADIASPVDASQNGIWKVCLSSGDGRFNWRSPLDTASVPSDSCYIWSGGPAVDTDKTILGDFNGDGRTDIAYAKDAQMTICIVRGVDPFATTAQSGFECFPARDANNTVIHMDGAGYLYSGDFQGKGVSGIINPRAHDGNDQLIIPNITTLPDLLTTITTGVGATTEIVYAPITDPSVYTKGSGADSANKEIDIQSPMYVVKTVKGSTAAQNGSSPFEDTYFYEGLRGTRDGRGLLGFAKKIVTDGNGIVTTTSFHQSNAEWWKAGRPAWSERKFGTVTLSRTDYQWTKASSTYPGVSLVYLSSTTERHNDLNGTVLPTTIVTTDSVDSWGNPLSVTTKTWNGGANPEFTKKVTTAYVSDSSAWLIGRPTRITVAYTGGTGNVTRTSSLAYHGLNAGSCTGGYPGALCSETIEPDTYGSNDPTLWQQSKYNYDRRGNRTSSTVQFRDAAGNFHSRMATTTYDDSSGRFAVQSWNALNQQESRQFDATLGLPTQVTSPNGNYVIYTYDKLGRKLGTTHYDAARRRLSEEAQTLETAGMAGTQLQGTEKYAVHSKASGGGESYVFFDSLGRPVRERAKAFAANAWVETSTGYDAMGRKASVTTLMGGATSSTGILVTTLTYDVLNRVVAQSSSDSSVPTVTTDYNGLVTTITRSNPGGSGPQQTVTTTNSQGWPIAVRDAAGGTTRFDYNAVGDRVTTTGPTGIAISVQYDVRGRKIGLTDPDTGQVVYNYNGLGELTYQRDAAGRIVHLGYDELGRQTSRTNVGPNGTSTVDTVWSYDCYKGIGKLCQVAATESRSDARATLPVTTRIDYDASGRPSSTTTTVGGRNWQTLTTYDANGRVASQRYPSGYRVSNVYDSWRGELVQINDPNNSSLWRATDRYLNGQIKRQTLGSGIPVDHTYDVLGRPRTITSGNRMNAAYVFDGVGNLRSRSDSVAGLATESFTYDLLNRVTNISAAPGSGAIGYDAAGNIKSRPDVGNYTYANGTHRVTLAGSVSYDYDATGNLISRGGQTVASWNAFGQPEHLQAGSNWLDYWYGPDRQRIKEVSSVGGATLMIGQQVFEAVDPANAGNYQKYRHYLRTPEGVAGVVTTAATAPAEATDRRFWLTDHLGSVVATLDAAGNVQERMGFDGWGKRRLPNGNSGTFPVGAYSTERGYTGHEMLDEVGLVHMNGRLYDPAIGRFLSPDPVVQAPMNGQSLNRYSYVMNNPLSLVDPSGYNWLDRTVTDLAWKSHVMSGDFAAGAIYRAHGYNLSQNQYVRVVGAAVAAYFTWGLAGGVEAGVWSTAAGGFAAGGIMGGNIESAVYGAFAAVMYFSAGELAAQNMAAGGYAWVWGEGGVGKVALHAAAGCATAAGQGGSCRDGAIAGGFAQAASPYVKAGGVAAAAASGAIAAKLSGGDATMGAFSAAFGYVFNSLAHPMNTYEAGVRQAILRGDVAELETLLGNGVLSAEDALIAQRVLAAMKSLGPEGAQLLASRYGVNYANTINHAFGQAKHNLGLLAQEFGSPAQAFVQVQTAVDSAFAATGNIPAAVQVGRFTVQVRGAIIDNAAHIRTLFIP